MSDKRQARMEKFLANYAQDKNKYKRFADHILYKIKNAIAERQICVAYSSAREKATDSLRKKCQKQIKNEEGIWENKYNDFNSEMMDLAGVRVVTYLLEDIAEVEKVIRSLFDVVKEHSGNKLELLGADRIGYLSVHYIVRMKNGLDVGEREFQGMFCEIQVRTVLQDAWAQIFHDRQYKNESQRMFSDKLVRKTNLLSGALELLDGEINMVIKEYDQAGKGEQAASLKKILELPLNEENIISYINIRLSRKVSFYDYKTIEKLLKNFGIDEIRDLDYVLEAAHCEEQIENCERLLSADRIINYILVIKDSRKFFETSECKIICGETFDFLNEFIDIESLCKKYGIERME